MKEINTLDDFEFQDRTVLLRVDINCPLDRETLRIINDARIRRISQTVSELLSRGARLVVLAHQSRRGKWDFTSLEQHAQHLSRYVGREVLFVDDVLGERALEAVRSLRSGEVLMLDNVRLLECETEKRPMEEHAESELVRTLAPLADCFICDAFGAAHRSQCSLVGFQGALPSGAGRLMAKELFTLKKIFDSPRRPSVFIIGGAKFGEAVEMVDNVLRRGKADTVLLTGLAGNAFLRARGVRLGEASEDALKEELSEDNLAAARQALRDHGPHLILPLDVAVERDGARQEMLVGDLPCEEQIIDIGSRSMEKYARVISAAGTSFMSGPAGCYERPGFEKGSKGLMLAMIDGHGRSVVGGGHTVGAAEMFDLSDQFSYVSTAGGALETFLLGKPLPVVEALKHAHRRERKRS